MSLRRSALSLLRLSMQRCPEYSASSAIDLRHWCLRTLFSTAECRGLVFSSADASLWASFGSQHRLFRSSILSLRDVEVEIQSMGESITEGSIAELLKKSGDSVAEDETIAQIETDKVTIDIKAPVSGTIKELRIEKDDTVKVGQIVALISEGKGGESEATEDSESQDKKASKEVEKKASRNSNKKDMKSSAEDSERSREQKAAKESSGNKQEGDADSRAHSPSISFPQRMTADGQRISGLSAEERDRHQQSEEKTQPSPATQLSQQPQPQKHMPWYVGKEQGTKLSQSRVLSQREMEQIELGGAEP